MSDQGKDHNLNRKSLETILREPLTRHRLLLKAKLRALQNPALEESFDFDDFQAFISSLPSQSDRYHREIKNALEAVKTGKVNASVDLKLPENQLVWAAALSYVMVNPNVMSTWDTPVEPDKFFESDLWQKTITSLSSLMELRAVGTFVNEALRDQGTKYAYARPGQPTRFDPKKNKITVNFVDGLTSGVEHMRAMAMREIGRALYSRKLPPRMATLQQEIVPLMIKKDKAKAKRAEAQSKGQTLDRGGLSDAEYKQLRMKFIEFNLRENLYNAAENNVRNKFATDRGQVKQQDFSVSLNNAGVTSESVGLERAPQSPDIPESLTRFMNLVNAVSLNFYQHNHLFADTDDGWRSVGVDPDLIRKIAPSQQPWPRDNQGIKHPDFQELRQILSGPDGLDKKMPDLSERMFGNFDAKAERSSEVRNEIIEKIFEDYADALIVDILKFYEDKLDQDLEQSQDQQQQADPNQQNPSPQPNSQNQQQQDPNQQDSADQQSDPNQQSDQQQQNPGQQSDPDQQSQQQQKENAQQDPSQQQQSPGQQDQNQDGSPQDADGQDGQEQDGSPQEGPGQEGAGQDADGDDQQDGPQQPGSSGQDGEQQGPEGQGSSSPDQDGGQQSQQQGGEQQPGDPQGENAQQGDVDNGTSGGGSEDQQSLNAEGREQDVPDFAKEQDLQDGSESNDQNGQSQDGAQGDPQNGGQQSDSQQGDSQQGDASQQQDSTVPVDGHGDMPDVGDSDTLQDAVDQEMEQQNADGQDADGQDGQDGVDGDGMTNEELDQAIKNAQQAEQAGQDGQDGQPSNSDASSNSDVKNNQAGTQQGKSLKELSEQSWLQYEQRIKELSPHIMRVRRHFKKIQERQLQEKIRKSGRLEIMPQDGEVMDRFNMDAHKNLILKKAMGDVKENDLKRFHKDESHFIPTTVDLVIMVDGSGSMNGVPLNSALQTAAILNEAASGKDMNMNVYVGLWGNENPPMIIKPGMTKQEIGRAMESARSGLHSGTTMSPLFKTVAKTIGEQHYKSNTLAGFTHIMIVSDGDITHGDKVPSKRDIETLFQHSDMVTIDVAVLRNQYKSPMEDAVNDVNTRKPYHDISVTVDPDPNKIPFSMVNMLLSKINRCRSFVAKPVKQKQRDMRRAANNMGRDRDRGQRRRF